MKKRNETCSGRSAERRPTDISCRKAQSLMSAFIDSMARNDEVVRLEAHVAACPPCQRQIQAYISVKNLLRSVDEPPIPEDLVLETRVRLSHERVPSGLRRMGERIEVWASNVVRPVAVPALVGVLLTLICFGGILDGMATYRDVQITDPTMARIERSALELRENLTVETLINVEGKVYAYTVLAGPENNPEVDRWLDDLLYVAQFKPATFFGRPIDSKLIMSFLGVS